MTELKIPKAISGEEIVWKQYGRRAFKQTYELPSGEVSDFYLLGASSRPVIIFPVTTDLNVIIIRQFRFAANKILYEIPGGNAKGEQTPEDTARDELLGETGYQASEIINLGTEMYFDPASWRVEFTSVLATGCRRVAEQNLDDTESIEVSEIPLVKWLKMIEYGGVRDSKSIAVTFQALLYLNFVKI